MPTFEITRGDATYEVEAPDVPTAVRDLDTRLGVKAPDPETTADDQVRGSVSGMVTGLPKIPLGLPALIGDIAQVPSLAADQAVDYVAGKLGYDTGLYKKHADLAGGYFRNTRALDETSRAIADTFIPPPVTNEGKLAREVTGAATEALGGSGILKLGASGLYKVGGQIFNSLAEAAEWLAAGPKTQAAYSAAAAGGGEIARQNDVNPLIGTALALAGTATGHAGLSGIRTAPAAFKADIDEALNRTVDAQERSAARELKEAAKDRPALEAWAQRAQAAEDAAERLRADPNATPQAKAAAEQAAREAHGELVAGSKPTTFEAAGEDLGVGSLQRGAYQENRGGYKIGRDERLAAQNEARVAELGDLGGQGTPSSVLDEFRRQRAALDQADEAAEATARSRAEGTARGAGTSEPAEAVGENIRGPVVAEQARVTAAGNKLYDDIAAEGVTVGTGRLKAAVSQHYRNVPESPLSPKEQHFSTVVKDYGDRVDFQQLRDLRSEMAARARDKNLNLKETRRAQKLVEAIDDAMDDGLARAMASNPSLVVNLDDALTQQYRAANRNWKENVKQPYELAPVEGIVEKAPTASKFEMTSAAIPEATFRPGNTGGEHLRALKAAGATDDALTEAAALSFQQKAIREGVVDPASFRRWLHNHESAIRELPPAVQARFLSANGAAEILQGAVTRRAATMKAFDQSAVGEVLGIPLPDLEKKIGAYLTTPSAAKELANRVAHNAQAKAGLQRLAADHILSRFKDASGKLSAAALTKYIDQNKVQLEAIFGSQGANRFGRLVNDIERTRRLVTVGKDPAGPGTAGDIAAMSKRALGATVMSLIAKATGAKGIAAVGAGKWLVNNLKLAGLNDVDEVLARALLNPEFASKLLMKAPAMKNAKFRKGLGTTILRSSLAGAAYGGNQ
jgi:hypothetical protein